MVARLAESLCGERGAPRGHQRRRVRARRAGELLATTSDDGSVHFWDLLNSKHPLFDVRAGRPRHGRRKHAGGAQRHADVARAVAERGVPIEPKPELADARARRAPVLVRAEPRAPHAAKGRVVAARRREARGGGRREPHAFFSPHHPHHEQGRHDAAGRGGRGGVRLRCGRERGGCGERMELRTREAAILAEGGVRVQANQQVAPRSATFSIMVLGTNFWPRAPLTHDFLVPRAARHAVLLQYNAVDTMVLDELVAATGIERGHVPRAGRRAARQGEGFKSKKIRVNVNLLIKAESVDVLKAVDEDREYAIQATIVRIMKARKTVKHQPLIQKVTAPKILDIKKEGAGGAYRMACTGVCFVLGASVPDVALVPVGGGAGAFCLVRGPCGDARRAAASGLSCRVLRAPRDQRGRAAEGRGGHAGCAVRCRRAALRDAGGLFRAILCRIIPAFLWGFAANRPDARAHAVLFAFVFRVLLVFRVQLVLRAPRAVDDVDVRVARSGHREPAGGGAAQDGCATGRREAQLPRRRMRRRRV
ncbi:hypothetical protein C8J57DRAFT_1470594 [Mycena rebaudengoi]|nr:hypothetical protein C8J57DRAFT_1470594 [Mycena rebaudengoi]